MSYCAGLFFTIAMTSAIGARMGVFFDAGRALGVFGVSLFLALVAWVIAPGLELRSSRPSR